MANCRPDLVLIYTTTEVCHPLVPVCSLSVLIELLHLNIRTTWTFGISVKEIIWQVEASLEARWPWGCVTDLLEGREGTFSAAPFLYVPVTSQKPEQLSGLGQQQTRISVLWHATSGSKFCPNSSHCCYLQWTLEFFLVFFLSSDAIKMKQCFKSFFWTCSFCRDHKELVVIDNIIKTP